MTIGIEPPSYPFTWRVGDLGGWITHDIMKCDICGSESAEGNHRFHLLYNGKWSKLFCGRSCYEEMEKEWKTRIGNNTYCMSISYYGDSVRYDVDESGLVEHIDTKGRVCKCPHPAPSKYNNGICRRCYSDISFAGDE